MIFVTVGSQAPFDRLIRAVDEWARMRAHNDVFAQIAAGDYRPKHVQFTRFLAPAEFNDRFQKATVVVAHAGVGSILSALELGKPIVVMPRRGELRETRNDHQVATAERFAALGRVIVAQDQAELQLKLDVASSLSQRDRIRAEASPELIGTIRAFLYGSRPALATVADHWSDIPQRRFLGEWTSTTVSRNAKPTLRNFKSK